MAQMMQPGNAPPAQPGAPQPGGAPPLDPSRLPVGTTFLVPRGTFSGGYGQAASMPTRSSFDSIDKNQDGVISRQEFGQAAQAALPTRSSFEGADRPQGMLQPMAAPPQMMGSASFPVGGPPSQVMYPPVLGGPGPPQMMRSGSFPVGPPQMMGSGSFPVGPPQMMGSGSFPAGPPQMMGSGSFPAGPPAGQAPACGAPGQVTMVRTYTATTPAVGPSVGLPAAASPAVGSPAVGSPVIGSPMIAPSSFPVGPPTQNISCMVPPGQTAAQGMPMVVPGGAATTTTTMGPPLMQPGPSYQVINRITDGAVVSNGTTTTMPPVVMAPPNMHLNSYPLAGSVTKVSYTTSAGGVPQAMAPPLAAPATTYKVEPGQRIISGAGQYAPQRAMGGAHFEPVRSPLGLSVGQKEPVNLLEGENRCVMERHVTREELIQEGNLFEMAAEEAAARGILAADGFYAGQSPHYAPAGEQYAGSPVMYSTYPSHAETGASYVAPPMQYMPSMSSPPPGVTFVGTVSAPPMQAVGYADQVAASSVQTVAPSLVGQAQPTLQLGLQQPMMQPAALQHVDNMGNMMLEHGTYQVGATVPVTYTEDIQGLAQEALQYVVAQEAQQYGANFAPHQEFDQ